MIHAAQAVVLATSIWALLATGRAAWALARVQRRTTALVRTFRALATDSEPSLAEAATALGLSSRLLVVDDEYPVAMTLDLVRPVVEV